ncbi:MAG: YtxH domain-containing protein [Chitinophagaceae bacterium]|nr:YtxH domain-containing protein [Chitinophagaceae bacterium]
MESTGKIVAGVLAGVAVGAVLGLLFAPDKGSTTRQKLTDSVKGFGQELADQAEGFISDKAGRVKNQAQNLAEKSFS